MKELTFLPPELYEEEARLRQVEYRKNQALETSGILNDLDKDDSPKKWIYSDGHIYAFVYKACDYDLWVKPAVSADEDMHKDQWCEVSDLTGVTVYAYQMLKEIAISIGWIEEDSRWLI